MAASQTQTAWPSRSGRQWLTSPRRWGDRGAGRSTRLLAPPATDGPTADSDVGRISRMAAVICALPILQIGCSDRGRENRKRASSCAPPGRLESPWQWAPSRTRSPRDRGHQMGRYSLAGSSNPLPGKCTAAAAATLSIFTAAEYTPLEYRVNTEALKKCTAELQTGPIHRTTHMPPQEDRS